MKLIYKCNYLLTRNILRGGEWELIFLQSFLLYITKKSTLKPTTHDKTLGLLKFYIWEAQGLSFGQKSLHLTVIKAASVENYDFSSLI